MCGRDSVHSRMHRQLHAIGARLCSRVEASRAAACGGATASIRVAASHTYLRMCVIASRLCAMQCRSESVARSRARIGRSARADRRHVHTHMHRSERTSAPHARAFIDARRALPRVSIRRSMCSVSCSATIGADERDSRCCGEADRRRARVSRVAGADSFASVCSVSRSGACTDVVSVVVVGARGLVSPPRSLVRSPKSNSNSNDSTRNRGDTLLAIH
jgi:hypothetical protein